jgi:hypothetical protein
MMKKRRDLYFFRLLGSTMFAAISSLLKFLKKSFQNEYKQPNSNHDEQQFRTAVINGIGKRRA